MSSPIKALKFRIAPPSSGNEGSKSSAGAKSGYVSTKSPLVISFVKVNEDCGNLFPLIVGNFAVPISSRSNRFRARQAYRVEVHDSVRIMTSALNIMYDDKTDFKRAMVHSKISSAKKGRARAVQD